MASAAAASTAPAARQIHSALREDSSGAFSASGAGTGVGAGVGVAVGSKRA